MGVEIYLNQSELCCLWRSKTTINIDLYQCYSAPSATGRPYLVTVNSQHIQRALKKISSTHYIIRNHRWVTCMGICWLTLGYSKVICQEVVFAHRCTWLPKKEAFFMSGRCSESGAWLMVFVYFSVVLWLGGIFIKNIITVIGISDHSTYFRAVAICYLSSVLINKYGHESYFISLLLPVRITSYRMAERDLFPVQLCRSIQTLSCHRACGFNSLDSYELHTITCTDSHHEDSSDLTFWYRLKPGDQNGMGQPMNL